MIPLGMLIPWAMVNGSVLIWMDLPCLFAGPWDLPWAMPTPWAVLCQICAMPDLCYNLCEWIYAYVICCATPMPYALCLGTIDNRLDVCWYALGIDRGLERKYWGLLDGV
jgi:hypothetical protein